MPSGVVKAKKASLARVVKSKRRRGPLCQSGRAARGFRGVVLVGDTSISPPRGDAGGERRERRCAERKGGGQKGSDRGGGAGAGRPAIFLVNQPGLSCGGSRRSAARTALDEKRRSRRGTCLSRPGRSVPWQREYIRCQYRVFFNSQGFLRIIIQRD